MTDEQRPLPADPREWRPQKLREGRKYDAIQNPIAEPMWSGMRVLVIFRDSEREDEWGTVEAIDEAGEDALGAAERAFDHLRRSIRAAEAVIDGIVTHQAGKPGVDIEFGSAARSVDAEDDAFVAIDLLRIDGELLLDVPLLERKRLLDGLIDQSPLVRVSPWVIPPFRPWHRTWRRAGFRGAVLKAANSRYVPGSISLDWTDALKEPDH